MNILKVVSGFVPFALFSFLARPIGVGWAALLGFVAAVVVVGTTRRGGVKSLPLLQAVILLVMAVSGFVGGPSLRGFVGQYGPAIAALVIGGFMLATAPRRPFTAETSRDSVPRELWHDPRFVAVNTKISTAWGLAVVALGLCPLAGDALADQGSAAARVTFAWIVPIIAVGLAVMYTRRTSAAAAKRIQAAHLGAEGKPA